MANSRQRKKQATRGETPTAAVKDEAALLPADVTHPAAPATAGHPPVETDAPPRRIRLITNPPEPDVVPSMMGRAIRPFAKPAQSGTFAPFAIPNARRGR
jgi:hypothetical protein